MKKTLLALALISPFAFHLSTLHAQRVVADCFDRLEVHYQTPALTFSSQSLGDSKALLLQMDGYLSGGEEGSPALPMRIDIIEIPFCSNISVEISNAVYDTLSLTTPHSSLTTPFPLQPSRFKSDTLAHAPVINAARYATDEFYGMPLATVEVQGVARDRRLANLVFSPVQVNPVTGQVIICRSADVVVRYEGADIEGTLEHYRRYHTPAFSAGSSLNKLFSTKDANPSLPIRMTIVAPDILRCKSLDNFAQWKRTQGLLVDLVYTDEQQLSSNTDIANFLKDLYTNASEEAPAPSYLLLVGDHGQLPAFDSRINIYSLNDHITDLYFVTWTDGDNLADCYQGRFSATDTLTLANIINKTLLYERYDFEDDIYLSFAALIAGEDNGTHQTSGWSADNAWIYCDPNMDYVAKTYINSANGYSVVNYYKNNVDFAPAGVTVTGYCSDNSSARALRTLYSEGLGWINYSAHGDWDRWHKPSFTTTYVAEMTNNGKPSFMIGNCCLTNKFNKPECFGEALLRKDGNAGAVGYIGGTNSTLWSEDFYWSVGIRTGISNTMDPDYDPSHLGMYDRLFHTHGESLDLYAFTAGSMVLAGNMAVNSSTSSYKLYYWEIYELMGDPSLLPWMGRAANLTASATRNGSQVTVVTVPNAYVAVVDSVENRLRASGFSDENGLVTFSFDNADEFPRLFLTVTAQGYKPFQKSFNALNLGISTPHSSLSTRIYPNPASSEVTVSVSQPSVLTVIDLQGRTVVSPVETMHETSIPISQLAPGTYFVRITTDSNTTVHKLIKK